MKTIIVVTLILISLVSCTTFNTFKECREGRQFFVKDKTCESGYAEIGITGHAPNCTSVEDIKRIKDYCGWYF